MPLLKKKGGGVGGGFFWQKQQGIKMVGWAVGLHRCEKCGGDGDGCMARMVVLVAPSATHRPKKHEFVRKKMVTSNV